MYIISIYHEQVSETAKIKVQRSIEAAASLNHLQLSLPFKVRIFNTNDNNMHCSQGHLLIKFTMKSLRAYIRDNELQRHNADMYCACLSDTWCD